MFGNSYSMTRRFAMEYGTFLGVAWVVDFILITQGLQGNGITTLLGFVLFMSLPILTIYLAYRFKQHQDADERTTFGRAAYFTMMLFMYAELLCFVCEYVYFAFIDNGHLINVFMNTLSDPMIVNEYKKMGMEQMLEASKAQMEQIAGMSPFDMAISLLGSNILTSIVLFVPTCIVAMMKRHG